MERIKKYLVTFTLLLTIFMTLFDTPLQTVRVYAINYGADPRFDAWDYGLLLGLTFQGTPDRFTKEQAKQVFYELDEMVGRDAALTNTFAKKLGTIMGNTENFGIKWKMSDFTGMYHSIKEGGIENAAAYVASKVANMGSSSGEVASVVHQMVRSILESDSKLANTFEKYKYGTSEYNIDKARQHEETMNYVKDYLKETAYFKNMDDVRLSAAAWEIASQIVVLKNYGFTAQATIGVIQNFVYESGCDPYVLQNETTPFTEYVNKVQLCLKLNDEDPYETGDNPTNAMFDPNRINVTKLARTPNTGVGLAQFTDCDTDYNKYYAFSELKKGMRRSNAIIEFQKTVSDPWTCIMKTNTFNYWIPSSMQSQEVDVGAVDEEASEEAGHTIYKSEKEVIEQDKTKLIKSTSVDVIALASSDIQLGFIENDDKATFMFNNDGRKFLDEYNGGAYADYKNFSYEDYKSSTFDDNYKVAVMIWCLGFERPGDALDRCITRSEMESVDPKHNTLGAFAKITNEYYDGKLNLDLLRQYGTNTNSLLAGKAGDADMYNSNSLAAHNAAMAGSGYWSESQAKNVIVQAEGNVEKELLEMAQRAYLSQKELNTLVDWEKQVQVDKFENKLVLFGRRFVLVIGIILMIWSMLLYLAYWFDKFNTLFYFDLVGKLTFNKLAVADCAEHSTYSTIKTNDKHKTLTVSHKDVFLISCAGFAISVLIVTGKLFGLIYLLMTKIFNFLQ